MMTVWIKIDSQTQKNQGMQMEDFRLRVSHCFNVDDVGNGLGKRRYGCKKAMHLKPQQILERLGGLPDRKFHCSVLGDIALREAIDDYFQK